MSLGASQSFDQQVLIKILRSSHRRCSVKKAQLCCSLVLIKLQGLLKKKDFNTGVLTNFAKFTVKLMCQSLFFNKVAGASCNFIKKETLAQVFSCEFYQCLGTPFLNPIQDGLFRGCSRMGGGGKKAPPSLKSVTHILQ